MKVMHVITGLEDGGAEGVLYRLCVNDARNTHIVISLMGDGKYGPLLRARGVKVYSLSMARGRLQLRSLVQLWRVLREHKPDVVQTWMYHADLLGGVIARLVGIRNVYWGIRHTTFDRKTTKLSTRLIVRLCAILSWIVPRKVICCAHSAVAVHSRIGYARHKFVVIPNGLDLTHFRPNDKARRLVRQELGVEEFTPLIGMVARFDPQKDHDNLLAALEIVKRHGLAFRCVLVGPGMDESNPTLRSLLKTRGLEEYVKLLGPRTDIPAVMNALDIHVLSSAYGEAFPNVVAEAMAAGTPCVVTDVGDSAWIVDNTGWIVKPRNPYELAVALIGAIREMGDNRTWSERNEACRARMETYFGLSHMIDAYQQAWRESC